MIAPEKMALNLAEAAEILGVSRSAVYDLVHVPGFPVVRLGRRILINRRLLGQWLDERAADGTKICLK